MLTPNSRSVETLVRCFLSPEEIPPAFRLVKCCEERLYLLDGQIRPWEGTLAEVSSPICLRHATMAGLNAAVRAWDHGRGPWPTMSVAARIAAVETFAAEMLTVRQEGVNLLMWEIGESFDDSGKEFDRTLQYIHKTVEALKKKSIVRTPASAWMAG